MGEKEPVGDGLRAIIVEGDADHVSPARDIAERLAEANNRKYVYEGPEAR